MHDVDVYRRVARYITFYFPALEDARVLVATMRAYGFTVTWDGTQESAVTIDF